MVFSWMFQVIKLPTTASKITKTIKKGIDCLHFVVFVSYYKNVHTFETNNKSLK
jgi:dimeric dUTPase (all-alpha-NTP-PPase superfamily)